MVLLLREKNLYMQCDTETGKKLGLYGILICDRKYFKSMEEKNGLSRKWRQENCLFAWKKKL